MYGGATADLDDANPTDMGVNKAGFAITDEQILRCPRARSTQTPA